MKMITDVAHAFLLEDITQDMIAVDFTMEVGLDTLVFSKYFKEIYAFEIDAELISMAQERLKDTPVTIYGEGHENCRKYLPYYDRGIFNLGSYLKKDNAQPTTPKTTLQAIRHALDLLKVKGRLAIILARNEEENACVLRFCDALNSQDYEVVLYQMRNKKQAPQLLMIEKKY